MAAEAAISSVVELLGNLLIEKVKFLRGVRGQVELLRDELTRMRCFLRDANKKQAEDDRVRNWIAEIRELAQDAEDAIEMFVVNVKAAESKGKLRRFSSLPKRTRYIDAVGKQIQSIQAKLESINRSRETYGIKDLGEVPEPARRSQVESRRRVSAWQNDEHLVGVEDDVEKLLQLSILNEEKRGLSVAVIKGMGGIGKSTLARKVYNHIEVVGDRFDCRGWVVVSSEFTPPETIKQLIIQLPRSKQEKQKLRELEESTKDELYLHEKLAEMLHKQLEGKSYLIVLDDVWESKHLESLITAFPNQQGTLAVIGIELTVFWGLRISILT